MASMVANSSTSSTSQVSPSIVDVQRKGSRNKRKFHADPPVVDSNKILSPPQNVSPSYELSNNKFEFTSNNGCSSGCDMCSTNRDHSDALRLGLGLSGAVSSEVGPSRPRKEIEASDEFHDADWSDRTETKLEELLLSNLDAVFKSAIKKIVACGYSEEVAVKAVLKPGICYGCKDTVSNVVDNSVAYLRNGQEVDLSGEEYFEDLQQMEKYILAELICVLREIRPSFSIGDAMWCLLICDMNVSHACARYSDHLNSIGNDGDSYGNSPISFDSPKLNLPMEKLPEISTSGPVPRGPSFQMQMPKKIGAPNLTKANGSCVCGRSVQVKEGPSFTSNHVEKTFCFTGTLNSHSAKETLECSRKISGITKRDYMFRHKSPHREQIYRTYSSRGSSRAGKVGDFGGSTLDKKPKPVSDCSDVSARCSSLRISNPTGASISLDNGNLNFSEHARPPSTGVCDLEAINTISSLPKTDFPTAVTTTKVQPALSAADTELSLSLPSKNNSTTYAGTSYDNVPGQPFMQNKERLIMTFTPRVEELQNQLQEWTEWANQKVMQAARRLSKDKAELKALRQEKEEAEQLKKEKKALEESTTKKLSEMKNALCKASGQVEQANCAVRRLEVVNAAMRHEMEAAQFQAAESASTCQEVSTREKKTLMKFQSREKQNAILQEDLIAQRRKLAQLQLDVGRAKEIQDQLEGKWKQEEKAKDDILIQASSSKKEREQIEASAKSKEDIIKTKAENCLQRYKKDIESIQKEISQLRLKTDSSKIAALRRGIDENHSRLTYSKNAAAAPQESQMSYISRMITGIDDYSGIGGVKRERECVMCLSEEMSVVFLPCAHQVVCSACNDLHEKQGMKDCPSCRSPIQRRISVRYACS